MNRLKKIFSALSDIGIIPASVAIRAAWVVVKAHHKADTDIAEQQAFKLIDRLISAVAGIAEDAEKSAAKGTPAPAAKETAS